MEAEAESGGGDIPAGPLAGGSGGEGTVPPSSCITFWRMSASSASPGIFGPSVPCPLQKLRSCARSGHHQGLRLWSVGRSCLPPRLHACTPPSTGTCPAQSPLQAATLACLAAQVQPGRPLLRCPHRPVLQVAPAPKGQDRCESTCSCALRAHEYPPSHLRVGMEQQGTGHTPEVMGSRHRLALPGLEPRAVGRRTIALVSTSAPSARLPLALSASFT